MRQLPVSKAISRLSKMYFYVIIAHNTNFTYIFMYRKCVGILLFNDQKQVFVAQRIDFPSDAWQLPQGGIEPDETSEQALFREMEEEIGTKNANIVAKMPNLLRYDLPKHISTKLWQGKYLGQEQQWFLLHFMGDSSEIDIATKNPEFSNYKWVDLKQIADLSVDFKRDLYTKLIEYFTPIIKSYEIK